MRRKVIAGNWKMNMLPGDTINFIEGIIPLVKDTENEVILLKDFEGECGEHYVLRNVDGNVVVFKIVNGIEEEYEKTDISIDYMTETDKISFENGLKVYGKQNLSQILEDFE